MRCSKNVILNYILQWKIFQLSLTGLGPFRRLIIISLAIGLNWLNFFNLQPFVLRWPHEQSISHFCWVGRLTMSTDENVGVFILAWVLNMESQLAWMVIPTTNHQGENCILCWWCNVCIVASMSLLLKVWVAEGNPQRGKNSFCLPLNLPNS